MGEKVVGVAIMTRNFKVNVKTARLNTYYVFSSLLSGERLEN